MKYREKLTVGGKTIEFLRDWNPIDNIEIESTHEKLKLSLYDVKDPELVPSNYDKPDGTPLTLLEGSGIRIDLSKRTVEEMAFWHRSADFDELIICFQGGVIWETDLGEVEMEPGQILLIPRGIAHRAKPSKKSVTNIMIEVKVWPELKEVVVGLDGVRQVK